MGGFLLDDSVSVDAETSRCRNEEMGLTNDKKRGGFPLRLNSKEDVQFIVQIEITASSLPAFHTSFLKNLFIVVLYSGSSGSISTKTLER